MIQFAQVSKIQGNRSLFEGASFQVNPGERVGLVGLNGAGKTTVFRLLVGETLPDSGAVVRPDRIRIGYYSQSIEEMRGRTVLEEACQGRADLIAKKDELSLLEAKLASTDLDEDGMMTAVTRYGELQSEFESAGGYGLEAEAQEILTGLGFPPEDHGRKTETYSGGWKMRIALAKILLMKPDVLLMDEPTNHLDLESIVWLEDWVNRFPGAVIMTSHDRDFMNRLVSRIFEVAGGTIHIYGGNYDFYERERDLRREQLAAQAKRQEEMLAKEEEFIARFAARASHAAQVQSRVKKLEKIDRIEVPKEDRKLQFQWPNSPRGGEEVVKLKGLGHAYVVEGKSRSIFQGADGLIKRLDRVAVVGVNGAGKSTFLKIIAGHLKPSEGDVAIGPSIELGYFSQSSLDVLDPNSTIIGELEKRVPNISVGSLKNLLGAFHFSGDDVEKKISVLSGGEKSRVVLAGIMSKPINCLVLDEPTNHLDLGSRESLLDALKRFDGTIIIVSHDRHFLRQIATRVFEVDKSRITAVDGGWDYYLQKRGGDRGLH